MVSCTIWTEKRYERDMLRHVMMKVRLRHIINVILTPLQRSTIASNSSTRLPIGQNPGDTGCTPFSCTLVTSMVDITPRSSDHLRLQGGSSSIRIGSYLWRIGKFWRTSPNAHMSKVYIRETSMDEVLAPLLGGCSFTFG